MNFIFGKETFIVCTTATALKCVKDPHLLKDNTEVAKQIEDTFLGNDCLVLIMRPHC